MSEEEYKKIKENLKSKMAKNDLKIEEYSLKITAIKNNRFEYKLAEIIGFSLIPYILFLNITSLLSSGAALLTYIPGELISILVAASSLAVGDVCRKILDKKFKISEKLKEFSNATTEKELLEEEIVNEIELEKTKNRNMSIQNAIGLLQTKKSAFKFLSDKSCIKSIDEIQTRKKTQEEIEKYSQTLKIRNEELDILSTKKVLHEKFGEYREIDRKKVDNIITLTMGVLVGLFSLVYCNAPSIINEAIAFSSNASHLLSFSIPFVLGTVGTIGYMIKTKKDNMKVFNKFNNKLGDDKLPLEIEDGYNEGQEINKSLAKKVDIVCRVENLLREQEIALERFKDSDDDKTLAKDYINEKEKSYTDEIDATTDDFIHFMYESEFVEKDTPKTIKKTVNERKNNNGV